MDKKAQQYWKNHQLWKFIKFFDICHNERTKEDDIMGVVEHNGWKFFASKDETISYITPSGEKGFFIDC